MVTQEEVEEPYNKQFDASNSRGRRSVAIACRCSLALQVARGGEERRDGSKSSAARDHAV